MYKRETSRRLRQTYCGSSSTAIKRGEPLAGGRARSAVLQLRDKPRYLRHGCARLSLFPYTAGLSDDFRGLKLSLSQTGQIFTVSGSQKSSRPAKPSGKSRSQAKPYRVGSVFACGQRFRPVSAHRQPAHRRLCALTTTLSGLGVSIPLTSARRNRGNIEAAVARQARSKLRREYLESVIPTQVEAAYQRWRAAQEHPRAHQTV